MTYYQAFILRSKHLLGCAAAHNFARVYTDKKGDYNCPYTSIPLLRCPNENVAVWIPTPYILKVHMYKLTLKQILNGITRELISDAEK